MFLSNYYRKRSYFFRPGSLISKEPELFALPGNSDSAYSGGCASESGGIDLDENDEDKAEEVARENDVVYLNSSPTPISALERC